MKTVVCEISIMNEINSRLYIAEEEISEFGDIVRKTIHNEMQREKD